MNDLDYPLFSIFAFLGFVVSLVPLPWHLHAWNSGTCYYMLWTSLTCLNMFINSMVWRGNAINSAPVWCDISIRIMLGSTVAIPAASLCINRRLYHIARVQAVMVTRAEVLLGLVFFSTILTSGQKRRAILIDTLLCVLWPLIFIALRAPIPLSRTQRTYLPPFLEYVVQGHRFDIYEGVGCYPYIYNTIVAFFLFDSWPIIIGLVSAVYCVLSLRAFYHRRVQFNEFLASNTTINATRYFRLMALASTEIMFTIPVASFAIWLNTVVEGVQPWISWENTHYDFSRVGQYPSILWTDDKPLVVAIQLSRWLPITCAFIFFAFFGFAAEARSNYRALSLVIVKYLGFTPRHKLPSDNSSLAAHGHAVQVDGPLCKYKSKSRGLQSNISFVATADEESLYVGEIFPYSMKVSSYGADGA